MVRRIILLCIFLLIFTIITSCLIFVKPDKYNYCGEYLDYLKKSPISKGSNVIFDSNGIPTVKIGHYCAINVLKKTLDKLSQIG
jgi:hypothetical protein